MLFNERMVPLTLVTLAFLFASCEPRPEVRQGSDISSMDSFSDYTVSTPDGRSLLVFDPISTMAALGSGGLSQLHQIFSAFISYITRMFPILAKLKDQMSSPGFRFPVNSLLEYYNLTSIDSVSEQSMRYLSLDSADCRYRAVCEACSYISTRVPSTESIVREASPVVSFNPSNPYSKAIYEGLTKQNCTESYVSCPKSPATLVKEYFKSLNS